MGDTVQLRMAESFGQTRKGIEKLIRWFATGLTLSSLNMMTSEHLHRWLLHWNRSGWLFANTLSPPCLPPSNPAVSTLVPNLTTSDIYINNKNRNTKNWQVRQVLQSAISILLFLKKMLRLVQICPKYCTLKELMIAVNVLSVHTGHEAQH